MTDGDAEAQGFKGNGSELTNVDAQSLDGMDTRINQYTRWIFISAHQLLDPYSTANVNSFATRGNLSAFSSAFFATDQNRRIFFTFSVPPDWDGLSNFVVEILFAGTQTPSILREVEWELGYKPASLGDVITAPTGAAIIMRSPIGPFYQAHSLLKATLGQLSASGSNGLSGKTMVGARVSRNGFSGLDDYGGGVHVLAIRMSYEAAH